MRFRITQTTVIEYEVNPEFYEPDATTPQEMLEIDLESTRSDPGLWLMDDDVQVSVTGEIINEEEN